MWNYKLMWRILKVIVIIIAATIIFNNVLKLSKYNALIYSPI